MGEASAGKQVRYVAGCICAWAFVGVWLIFGGLVLSELELQGEKERSSLFCGKLTDTLANLDECDQGKLSVLMDHVIGKGLCRAPACNEISNNVFVASEDDLDWHFAGATFYCLTAITTIG
jgi:hypothetical protein